MAITKKAALISSGSSRWENIKDFGSFARNFVALFQKGFFSRSGAFLYSAAFIRNQGSFFAGGSPFY